MRSVCWALCVCVVCWLVGWGYVVGLSNFARSVYLVPEFIGLFSYFVAWGWGGLGLIHCARSIAWGGWGFIAPY